MGLDGAANASPMSAGTYRALSPPGWTILVQFFLTLAPALWLLRDRMFARLTEAPLKFPHAGNLV